MSLHSARWIAASLTTLFARLQEVLNHVPENENIGRRPGATCAGARLPIAALRPLLSPVALLVAFFLVACGVASSASPAPENFGSVNLGHTSSAVAISVPIATSGTPASISVLTQGVSGLDFNVATINICPSIIGGGGLASRARPECAVVSPASRGQVLQGGGNPETVGSLCATGTPYTSGNFCYVGVTFSPKAPGLRLGAVVLRASNGTVLGTTYFSGTGVAPLVALTPGQISTIAGNGLYAPILETSPTLATSTALKGVVGVAVDAGGNLFFADSNNEISTIPSHSADIELLAGGGGNPVTAAGVAATSASFTSIALLALDGAGYLYIVDNGDGDDPSHSQLDRYDPVTKMVTLVAGGGSTVPTTSPIAATSAKFSGLYGAAVDGFGDVYFTDTNNRLLLKLTMPANGNVSTATVELVAGGGSTSLTNGGNTASTTAVSFGSPMGVAIDGSGNLYVADSTQNTVDKIPANTTNIQAIIGAQPPQFSPPLSSPPVTYLPQVATNIELSNPTGLAVDAAGNLYIAAHGQVDEFTPASSDIVEIAGGGNNKASTASIPATWVHFGSLNGIALDLDGNLYIAETGNNQVDEIPANPTALSFANPTAVSVKDTSDGTPTVTVSNIGNATLSIAVPDSGINPNISTVAFGEGTSTCSWVAQGGSAATLALGTNCTYGLTFTPAEVGLNSASLTLTDNNLLQNGSTQSVALTGVGAAPADATATTVTSSSYNIGLAQSVTLTATVADTTTPGNTPTGTVAFTDTVGGATTTLNGAVALDGTGKATLNNAFLLVDGVHTITATYAGSVEPEAGAISKPGNFARSDAHSVLTTFTPTSAATYTSSTNTATITVGAATHFQVLANSPQIKGVGFSVTVTALDATNNTALLYSGTVAITSGDGVAVLPPSATLTNGIGNFTVTLNTLGLQSITATDTVTNTLTGTTNVQVNAPPVFTVTVQTDTTTGVATNCTNQSLVGATPDPNCSLRDALAAAAAFNAPASESIARPAPAAHAQGIGGAKPADTPAASSLNVKVNFASALTNSPTTIKLLNGQLLIPSYTDVSGVALPAGGNAITVDGNYMSPVFNVASGILYAEIDNLNLTNGSAEGGGGVYTNGGIYLFGVTISNCSGGDGAGIYVDSSGGLLMNSSTISSNFADSNGGGIYNAGTLTILNSTITGNNALGGNGGGLYLTGTHNPSLTNVTIAGNGTEGNGAGIYVDATHPTYQNTFVAGNVSNVGEDDCEGENGCPSNGINGNFVTGLGNLSTLGNYGGPTPTMLPLPGSAALCAGTTGGPGYDQRGDTRPVTYGSTSCIDSGAVQTHYSLAFVQQPTNAQTNSAIAPSPTVQLSESGTAISLTGAPVTLSAAAGSPSGTLTENTGPTGLATFSGISFSTAETADTLTASAAVGEINVTATSNTFNIIAVDHLGITVPPTAIAGTAFNVTVTGYDASNNVVTGYTGPITFTSSDGKVSHPGSTTLVNGVVTVSVTLRTAGNQTVTATDATSAPTVTSSSILVSAGAAANLVKVSGGAQRVVIGAQFTSPLAVKVTDAWGNPISGAKVTFTPPLTGASATLPVPALTAVDGTTSTTPTANGVAGQYSVTVTTPVTPPAPFVVKADKLHLSPENDCVNSVPAGGARPQTPCLSGTVSFSLTNLQATTVLTVTPTATPLVYGQPVTLNAAIAPANIDASLPTGTVTFADNGAALSPASTVASAAASYTVGVPTVGQHPYSGSYSGDNNFTSALTTGPSTVTVNQASVTLATTVAQPVSIIYSQGTTVPFTVTGQYTGTGIALPTGSASYTIVNASSTTVASGPLSLTAGTGNAGGTVPVGAALAPGNYTINIGYGGDGNYNASTTPLVINLTIGPIPTTINWTAPSPIVYGSALFGILNATATAQIVPEVHTVGGTRPQAQPNGVPGTYAYTATPSGGTAIAVTSPNVLPAGSYTLGVTFTPQDPTNYKSATGAVPLTVTQFTPGIQLASSVNPVLVQNAINFTVTLTGANTPTPAGTGTIHRLDLPTAGLMPTGTVTFLDGTTPIGTGTVDQNGLATFTTSALAVGVHPITATYGGDNNYTAASTAPPLSELVQDFNVTITISGSGGSTGVTSVSALPGGTAVYNFTLSPVGSATFPATVTLSASGYPAGATYKFDPPTLAAGTGKTDVTLTIQLPPAGSNNSLAAPPQAASPTELAADKSASRLPFLALALLLLPFAGRMRKTGRKLGRMLPLLVLLISGLAAAVSISGCGGKPGGYFGQPPVTYTILVTGTSGTLSHSTSVTLTVQ